MNLLPQARTENIVVRNLKDEVLIYDLATDRALCLNRTAGRIFECCDGRRTFEDLKREFQFTDDLIYLSLDELRKHQLIADEYVSPLAGMSRREAVRRVGLATMTALPVVIRLTAPAAAEAASNQARAANGQTCSTAQSGSSRQCLSGYCAQTTDGSLRCCTKVSSEAGSPYPPLEILGGPESTCNQRTAAFCCSGQRATQYGSLCVCV